MITKLLLTPLLKLMTKDTMLISKLKCKTKKIKELPPID
jgi:hypothetical protein